MIRLASTLLLGAAALSSVTARPMAKRTVTSLNQAAFQEAQQRDDTATRALSGVEIKTSDGQCLFVDPLSGDFRANLAPIQAAACNGSQGQLWDVITAGKHNNKPGFALIVNTLTNACMNLDDRRAAGDQVIMFSCGGRGDGSGGTQDAQLFPFNSSTTSTIHLAPKSPGNVCFVSGGARLVNANCDGSADQTFTFGSGSGSGAAAAAAAATSSSAPAATEIDTSSEDSTCPPDITLASTVTATAAAETQDCAVSVSVSTVTSVVTVTVTAGGNAAVDTAVEIAVSTSSAAAAAKTTTAAATVAATAGSSNDSGILNANPTTPVPVSRAGGTLNPTSAAESNQRDNTATRAFSSVSIRSNSGKCLFIDPTAGDFRQNLIPVALKDCDGSPNEKFDIITSGKHDNTPGSSLVVSSLTQGCLNFDPRRAAGDTVILFSCGGRADGEGQTTDSQTFKINGNGAFVLSPDNSKNATCLAPNAAGTLLDSFPCDKSAGQTFTIA